MTPGACKSDFDRESEGIGRLFSNLLSAIIARTTEAGSRTLVHGISVGEESNGTYIKDCQIHEYVTLSHLFNRDRIMLTCLGLDH
jgi:retinol dehydrogenase-12